MSISNIANTTTGAAANATGNLQQTATASTASKIQKFEKTTQEAKLSPKELSDIVQKANKALQESQSGLKFQLDPDSGKAVVQIVDQETQKVIKQIPSAEMLKLAKSLEKLQGVLMSQQA